MVVLLHNHAKDYICGSSLFYSHSPLHLSSSMFLFLASAYSLLQAAHEISFQGDGRDRDVNIFVQRSLLRQSAPLESLIRDKLSAKPPKAYEWFWSKQVPMVAASFFNYLEEDLNIISGTAVFAKGLSSISGNGSDISLLLLALTCNAAITKLGTTKVSCPRFFSMSADISRRLMDMLVDFIPVCQAYHSIKHIGLRREFLVHFGPRVAACRVKNDRGSEEVIFWVNQVQKQLQQAINRERIWSRLTTSESIEGDAEIGQTTTSMSIGESESNEIRRFELLRNELMELEKRVQKSTDQYENEEDVLQGTQLLAIDVAASMGLLKRLLIGDELTEKERKKNSPKNYDGLGISGSYWCSYASSCKSHHKITLINSVSF